jgi:hypothetical protein
LLGALAWWSSDLLANCLDFVTFIFDVTMFYVCLAFEFYLYNVCKCVIVKHVTDSDKHMFYKAFFLGGGG